MALLSFDEEYDRAHDTSAFSNSTDGHAWMGLWCEDCNHYEDCPLILVAMMGRTPLTWSEREPRSLNRYTCREFDDVTAEHQPTPTVGEE